MNIQAPVTVNPFPDYMLAPAPDDDTFRPEWARVRASMDTTPLPPIQEPPSLGDFNEWVNLRIKYTAEPEGVSIWKNPAATWADQAGDCKDYASLKYAMLLRRGVPESDLLIVEGTIWIGLKIHGDDHAWLLARGKVLDNKFDQLIQPSSYLNFVPKKCASGSSVWLFSKAFTISSLANKSLDRPGIRR